MCSVHGGAGKAQGGDPLLRLPNPVTYLPTDMAIIISSRK